MLARVIADNSGQQEPSSRFETKLQVASRRPIEIVAVVTWPAATTVSGQEKKPFEGMARFWIAAISQADSAATSLLRLLLLPLCRC